MNIRDVSEILEQWLQRYSDEGSHCVFYNDDKGLDVAKFNYYQVEIALEALSKIKNYE